MVIKPFTYFKFTYERALNQGFKFTFSKNMIVAMVNCRLFILLLQCRLYKIRLFWFSLLCSFLLLFIGILQMPRDKHILSRKLFFSILCISLNAYILKLSVEKWCTTAIEIMQSTEAGRIGRSKLSATNV